jgi:hypothetical protein
MESNHAFANDVRRALEAHWSPATVTFLGSFASGAFDRYSDVDLQANVHVELDQAFYVSFKRFLEQRYGPFQLRYDPDYKDNPLAQGLRISFYAFPVFWRIDLDVESDRPCQQKWPEPFPEWSVPQSAFWNVVWAVKYGKRGMPDVADHYMSCAVEKLAGSPLPYSEPNVMALLKELAGLTETDKRLISKLMEEIEY